MEQLDDDACSSEEDSDEQEEEEEEEEDNDEQYDSPADQEDDAFFKGTKAPALPTLRSSNRQRRATSVPRHGVEDDDFLDANDDDAAFQWLMRETAAN